MTANAVHLGWAYKQGQHRASWKRRFFVLNEDGIMAYYTDESVAHMNGKFKGKFQVDATTELLTEKECPPLLWPDDKRRPKTGFGIRTTARTYFLYCTAEEDADKWLSMLKTCIQTMQPRDSLHISSDEDGDAASSMTLSSEATTAMQAVSNRVFVRLDELNNQVMRLETDLWRSEDANQQLLEHIRYLELQLKSNNITFEPMQEGFEGFEKDADNYPADTYTSVDVRIQFRAVVLIQRWWRAKLLRKRHDEVLARVQERRMTQYKDERPSQKGLDERSATRGRAARKERAPSTSLGLRKSVSGYGTVDGRRTTSTNRRLLPKVTTLAMTSMLSLPMGMDESGMANGAGSRLSRLSDASTLGDLDEQSFEYGFGANVSVTEHDSDDDQGPIPEQTLQLLQMQTLPEPEGEELKRRVTRRIKPQTSVILEDEEATTTTDVTNVTSATDPRPRDARAATDTSSTSSKMTPVKRIASAPTRASASRASVTSTSLDRKNSTASFFMQPETVEDINIRHSRVALYRFNRKPHKGIKDLVDAGLVENDPQAQISFLCEQPGISRRAVGELLGHAEEPGPSLLQAYADTFDFRSVAIDTALRLFLLPYRIPGEAQKIERVLIAFSKTYYDHNPDMFNEADTALVLAFSIMMLHTDLHNDNNVKKMTLPEFVRNNRGIDAGDNIQEAILKGIYVRIQKEEFQCTLDHTSQVETYEARIVNKMPVPVLTEERAFVAEADVAELSKKGKKSAAKRIVTLVVFNDLLLVLSRSRWERKYAYRHHFELQEMTLIAAGKSPAGPAFDLHQNMLGKCVFKFAVIDEGVVVTQLRNSIKLAKEALNKDFKLTPPAAASEC
eukprot:TRINITY_DN12599_c1_g17_i1.p1 TRINITY_DN12599_c1_g17~~TRINITY_DN12599_c1_g17_i1.p1  ORF type:complete len:845 (+),score=251.17 TRINITY_DN12599_c1_g17_i1:114-2648(+)